MAEQLLSTDPHAGQLLSTDPAAGAAPADGPRMGPPTANTPVTLGDVIDNPTAAIQRIGASLKRDVSDPKLWLSLAAAYFGPKMVPGATRAIAGAMKGAKAVGGVLEPGDIGIVSPRIGKVVDLAGRVRGALQEPAPAEATPPPPAERPPPTEFEAAQAARQAATKNPYPDQKALNEAALKARRDAYAASQQGVTAGPVVKASGKMQLTAPEMQQFTRLLNQGMPLPQALEEVTAMRELAARLGGASPAEVAKAVAHRKATGKW
jgi:hypothetical protein